MHTIKQLLSKLCESLVETEALNVAFAAVLALERQMLHGIGLVRKTWRSFDCLDRTQKEDRSRHTAKNQTAFFPPGTFLLQKVESAREGTKLT